MTRNGQGELFPLSEGERRKAQGQFFASGGKEENDADDVRREFFELLKGLIRNLSRWKAEIHADDLDDELDRQQIEWPEEVSRNVIGAAWTACARAGFIKKTNTIRASKRAARHANETPVWKSVIYHD